MEEKFYFLYLDVITSLLLNIGASCCTIFVNKYLFKNNFKFGTFLTVLHFIFTFIMMLCLSNIGLNFYQIKKFRILKVLPICFAFSGYVVFNNISLVYNSVSFYQIMKILCTPTIILIKFYFYGEKTTRNTILSLLPVCVGIFIAIVTDTEINVVGTIWAILAVGSNSMYTIYGKTKQNELEASAMQLLLYQSFI
jgi:solute carrier family 35, member E3